MKTLDPLAGVSVFAALAETLNFGASAEKLGMSRATVSAQIAELETRLGVRLFHRSTRAVRLTEAGEAYRNALGGVVDQVTQAGQVAQSYQVEAVGRVRLTAPAELCPEFILPAIVEFLDKYPGVAFDMELTPRRVDIIKENFDLAIRSSLSIEPNLIVRRLGRSPVTLTAAPAYLKRRGKPKTPDNLAGHTIIHHSGLKAGQLWVLRRNGEERRIPVNATITTAVGAVLAESAEQGLGITYLPRFLTGAARRAGRLVEVLSDWAIEPAQINAIYPSNRNITPKVRRFVGLLAKRFEGHADFV